MTLRVNIHCHALPSFSFPYASDRWPVHPEKGQRCLVLAQYETLEGESDILSLLLDIQRERRGRKTHAGTACSATHSFINAH